MGDKKYQLRYLPLFEQDLIQTVRYISNELQNPDAAEKLLDDIERAILKRLDNPLAFEPFQSIKRRALPYYRIYIRNYAIYYVVTDGVMEVRRLLYQGRDKDKYL